MSSFSVGQALGTIVLGYISDKYAFSHFFFVSLVGNLTFAEWEENQF